MVYKNILRKSAPRLFAELLTREQKVVLDIVSLFAKAMSCFLRHFVHISGMENTDKKA